MSEVKPKTKSKIRTRIKFVSKSKRSSPRLYGLDDLPPFMQPLIKSRNQPSDQRHRRPKSEIVRELRRLRAQPLQLDEDGDPAADAAEVKRAAQPLQSLEQLDALRLTRQRIEQLMHCISFEQAVRSCFVRLNISAANQLPEYRIAEILDVTELPMGYYVGRIPTNIVLQLRYDDLAQQHELNDISNMAFTRPEFEFWQDNCFRQGIELPTTELLVRKKIELYNALNSETKVKTLLKQKGLQAFAMPMRPPLRGGLLERFGGVYPWKLQRPPSPTPVPPPDLVEREAAVGSEANDASELAAIPEEQRKEPKGK